MREKQSAGNLVIEMNKNGMDTNKDKVWLKAFTCPEYACHFGLFS